MTENVFLQPATIDKASSVTDIVLNNYRTADVFFKYNIEFCCGGKWPLEMACTAQNLDVTETIQALEKSSMPLHSSTAAEAHNWSTGFLIDFIINVHHEYLRTALPITKEYINRFMEGHQTKFPWLQQLQAIITELHNKVIPFLRIEEETFFPYIDQITNAYVHGEPYAALFAETLRKPLQATMRQEWERINSLVRQMRQLTNDYTIPENACVTHKVTFLKLQELDNDITQHLYLENAILLPRAIKIEKELLA